MSDYIEKFCDNFHKLKAKNGIVKRIHFDRNDNEANFYWDNDVIARLPFHDKNEISKFYK
jgi:hypothetical protein